LKIAVCISGAVRNSSEIIASNLGNLKDLGHEIDVYMHLQKPSTSFRNSYDGKIYSKSRCYLPYINGFETNNVEVQTDIPLSNELKIRFESRTFEQILFDFGLEKTWHQLQNIEIEIPGTSKTLRPHLPHFRNTLFMLVNMYEAERLREQFNLTVDGVLRLRPDFLMSQSFLKTLDPKNLIIPIRTSGSEFNYGWGHSSDQCFFSNPSAISSISNLVLHLEDLWSKEKVYVPESFSAPFLYGDVLFGYWMKHRLNTERILVPDGGDLVRENIVRKYLWNRDFLAQRNQYLNWVDYNRSVAKWQNAQRKGSPSN
jgi:hypothetical protein